MALIWRDFISLMVFAIAGMKFYPAGLSLSTDGVISLIGESFLIGLFNQPVISF